MTEIEKIAKEIVQKGLFDSMNPNGYYGKIYIDEDGNKESVIYEVECKGLYGKIKKVK